MRVKAVEVRAIKFFIKIGFPSSKTDLGARAIAYYPAIGLSIARPHPTRQTGVYNLSLC